MLLASLYNPATATSFMLSWSPSRHVHIHMGCSVLGRSFSRNGLCNGVKNKQGRPRWRPRCPTVPMVVGSNNGEALVGFSGGEEQLYLEMVFDTCGARLHPRPESEVKFLHGVLDSIARIEAKAYG
ncbi:hypothetical protein ACFX2G_035026 [Malus domestica]